MSPKRPFWSSRTPPGPHCCATQGVAATVTTNRNAAGIRRVGCMSLRLLVATPRAPVACRLAARLEIILTDRGGGGPAFCYSCRPPRSSLQLAAFRRPWFHAVAALEAAMICARRIHRRGIARAHILASILLSLVIWNAPGSRADTGHWTDTSNSSRVDRERYAV